MKAVMVVLVVGVTGLWALGVFDGRQEESLRDKYGKLRFNMPVSEVVDLLGKPDLKVPQFIGEHWIWIDGQHKGQIKIYITPDKTILMRESRVTPGFEIEMGRLVTMNWSE